MDIQTYQIQNVLRTYGHLDELKRKQGEEDIKQTEQSFPAAASLSEETFVRFKIRRGLTESDDPTRDP